MENRLLGSYEEANGPLKSRKINPAPDNRNFQTPRINGPIDIPKPKFIPEGKVRLQDGRISNIESKPVQAKKVTPKANILHKDTNQQALKTVPKQELKYTAQKLPVGVNKVGIQKKKMLAALKNKASIPLATAEITPTSPKSVKVKKIPDIEIQKTKPQEKTIATEKINLVSDISPIKNQSHENDSNVPTVKANNNSSPCQDTKPQEKTPNTKPATEITKNINRNDSTLQEKKPQKRLKNDKVSNADSEKPSTDQSEVDEPLKEKIELDPVLACAVEEELQDIMIQVWQELPDDPLEEEDRIAVDKLRNEAGDDLRRVLGLNITKRLLNVFNNLFIKMQFTCRPQIGCLTSFLNQYNITKFKRIDKNFNTFAAQMETIEDFDKLCSVKELMCGEAKVSITPCYKYTQCPDNLKTIYDDTYFYEDTHQEHTESFKWKNSRQKTKVTTSEENVCPAAKLYNIDKKSTSNLNTTETEESKSVRNDAQCQDVEKDSRVVDKVATNSSQVITNDNKSEQKQVTDDVTNKKENIKEVTIIKENDTNKYAIKGKLESDDDDFESGVPETQMEEEEELDDEDILALMSEGVVLDECSGSADEN